MQKEILKNNLLVSYNALAEYEKYWGKAQRKLNSICSKMKDKRKKDNLILGVQVSLGLYLVFSFLSIISYVFFEDIPGSVFYRIFLSLANNFKFFTFQSGRIFPLITYGVLIFISWWFYNSFNEDDYEKDLKYTNCNHLMQIYREDSDFKNELDDFQILKQESYNFTQTEQFKNDVAFIPNKYRKAGIVARLFNYIDDKRADTFKEAINLYENESHQERIELEQKRQSDSIRRAEEASIRAQNAARNAEINSRYRDSVDVTIRHK